MAAYTLLVALVAAAAAPQRSSAAARNHSSSCASTIGTAGHNVCLHAGRAKRPEALPLTTLGMTLGDGQGDKQGRASGSRQAAAPAAAGLRAAAAAASGGDADASGTDVGQAHGGPRTDAETATQAAGKPPHILITLLDDVGWNDFPGFSGDTSSMPVAPVMQGLMQDGVKLTSFYVTPMCSPTRAALFTGRFPFRYGAQHFVQKPMQPTFLPADGAL